MRLLSPSADLIISFTSHTLHLCTLLLPM